VNVYIEVVKPRAPVPLLLLAFAVCSPLQSAQPPGPAAALGAELRNSEVDPDACYRVRDISLHRGELGLYFTEGYLAFTKPIAGRRIMAVFASTEVTHDAEILVRPPNRGERSSLASFTGSPTLDEHFKSGVLIFTDSTAEELQKQIDASPSTRPASDIGFLLASNMNEVVRNLASSFQVRLVLDLLTGRRDEGMLYAALSGTTLGNFDALYDPTAQEEIILGRVTQGNGASDFEIWASFQTRARMQEHGSAPRQGALKDFKIDAELKPDLTLDCVTRVTLVPARPLSGALFFEIAPAMAVTSVKLDGAPMEVYRRESFRANLIGNRRNEPFLVVLPAPLEQGKAYQIEFRHSGKVITSAGNNVFFVGARMSWYPARGFGHSLYDLTFRTPKPLQVVATGDLVEERDEGDMRVTRWRTQNPVRMAGFNLGEYREVTVKREGLTVEVFGNRRAEPALQVRAPQIIFLPPFPGLRTRGQTDVITLPAEEPDPKARLAGLADEIASAFEWMARSFGPPPLKTLTVSPIPGNFGQGFPGLVYLSTISFLNERQRPIDVRNEPLQLFYSEILHAHEVAHQWWGNLVVPASYHDEWIDEALANYTALLVLERKKGSRTLSTVLGQYLANLGRTREGKTVESAGPITWGFRLEAQSGVDPWRIITYEKGSWIIHMLRRRLGDKNFLAMLAELCRRYEYRTFTTDEFRQLAAEFSPEGLPDHDLELFFDTWVYSTGVPTLELNYSVKGRAPNLRLNVNVKQSGVPDDFSVDLPVAITLPGQKVPLVRWVRTGSESSGFSMTVQVAPTRVEMAPGEAVLAHIK
jgi:hypothetical protein